MTDEDFDRMDRKELAAVFQEELARIRDFFKEIQPSEAPVLSDNMIAKMLGVHASLFNELKNGTNPNRSKDAYRRGIEQLEAFLDRIKRTTDPGSHVDQHQEEKAAFEKQLQQKEKSIKWTRRGLIGSGLLLAMGAFSLNRTRHTIEGTRQELQVTRQQLKNKEEELGATRRTLNQELQEYKLWSAYRGGDEGKIEFDALISGVKEYLTPDDNAIYSNKIALLLNELSEVNSTHNSSSIPTDYSEINEAVFAQSNKLIQQNGFEYDLETGVYSYSPSGKKSDGANLFSELNQMTSTKKIEASSVEEALLFLLGEPDLGSLEPILLYALIFDKGDPTKADMYRYPRYRALDKSKDELDPYRDYDHNKRPFFEDYRSGNCYQLAEIKAVKMMLSPVYSDFKKSIVTPIRTLIYVYEKIQGNNCYLLCLDLKMK